MIDQREGTFRVSRVRGRSGDRKQVRFGAPDASLSAEAGVPATTAGGLARRFGPAQRTGIETGIAALLTRVFPLLAAPCGRR